MIAQAKWEPMYQETIELIIDDDSIKLMAKKHGDPNIRSALKASLKTKPAKKNLIIHIEKDEQSSVLGVTPSLDLTEQLGDGENGWRLINYCGMVGWVKL